MCVQRILSILLILSCLQLKIILNTKVAPFEMICGVALHGTLMDIFRCKVYFRLFPLDRVLEVELWS